LYLFNKYFNIAYRNMQYMAQVKNSLKPQDVMILLKIIAKGKDIWFHHTIAEELGISQSEVSQSLTRCCYAGLIDASRKKVNRLALMELLSHGISYVFPQHPGSIVRGMLTAHSAMPLNQIIKSSEKYVWPHARGDERGQAVEPLYGTAVAAASKDVKLYELLALVDALRVGRAREKEIAKKELEKRILHV
jgi:DNA-binding MarR family transcriptional regulator